MERKTKIQAAVVCGIMLVMWGAWKVYAYMDRIPGSHEVHTAIERTVPTPSQRVVDVSTTVVRATGGTEASLQFSATMENTESYYSLVDSAQYFDDIKTDATVYNRIRSIVGGPGREWICKEAGYVDEGSSLADLVLLRETGKANTHYTVTGYITARRPLKTWELAVENVQSKGVPVGYPRGHFKGNVLFVDRPGDVQKLKASLADAQTVLSRLEDSQRKYRAKAAAEEESHRQKLAADEESHRQALLAKVSPKTLFAGFASRGNDNPQPLWLEITDLDLERKTIRTLLRNDGGWDDSRRLDGTFEIDTSRDRMTFTLKTDVSQALRNCGPFLEFAENYTLAVALDGELLAGTAGNWSVKMTRVADDAKRQAEIALVRKNAMQWLEATKAGMAYKLTASLPERVWSEEYFFTFTKQEKDGLIIEGTLELPSRGFKRVFTGTLIANKYRADRKPLRLFTAGANAVAQAHELSPLRLAEDFYWYPQLDGTKMRLDDNSRGRPWHLEFDPASAGDPGKARKESLLAAAAKVQANKGSFSRLPPGLGIAATDEEAVVILKSANEAGAHAEAAIGVCYILGRGVPVDPAKGIEWIQRGVAAGDPEAVAALGRCYGNGDGVAKDPAEGSKLIRRAAEAGNAHAMANMGFYYVQGFGVTKDTDEALRWFRKGAEAGSPLAQTGLGLMYWDGNGITKDREEAARLFHKGADDGDATAMRMLGVCYETGDGVVKNLEIAGEWYTKAAAAGDVLSMRILGASFEMQHDYRKAMEWYRRAADLGDVRAKNNIGWLYFRGLGAPVDYVEAARWYEAAADGGDADGSFSLGMIYLQGQGVRKNEAQGFQRVKFAAEKGNAVAMEVLGMLYDSGTGTESDFGKAREWHKRAKDAGYKK